VIIESPTEAIDFEPLPTDDDSASVSKIPEPYLKPRPITASFRKTIRHLQAVGGFAARFRGFAVFAIANLSVQTIGNILSVLLPRTLANIIARVAVAQLSLAWTHIVISEPSPKPWYRRLPAAKTWRKVAGPTALLAFCEQLVVFIPVCIAIGTDMTGNPSHLTSHEKSMLGVKALLLVLLGLVLSVVLVLPANIILTRVQASLLPDIEETIVPFDRSFGGKVVPEVLGGDGIGLLDAWRTFDLASRVRLMKAYAKALALQFAVWVLFLVIFGFQLFMVVGKDFSKLIPDDGKNN